jgi:hypothetical protein
MIVPPVGPRVKIHVHKSSLKNSSGENNVVKQKRFIFTARDVHGFFNANQSVWSFENRPNLGATSAGHCVTNERS